MTKIRKRAVPDGADGWDQYADFYDWENAQTVGRRDITFWQNLARRTRGRVLELGAGTGRLTVPLARAAGARVTGIDRSGPMLARAIKKIAKLSARRRPTVFRGDIRALPFRSGAFHLVIAPYGMLQSLTRERDLKAALAEIARVTAPRGVLGVDLVPDLPVWDEYKQSVRLHGKGPRGSTITLIESVRQDRRRGLTIFDQTFVATPKGGPSRRHRFALVFRTLPVPAVCQRLARAGFAVDEVMGNYRGGRWDPTSDVWLLLARRLRRRVTI